MITENLSTLKIHKLTQEQYDRELKNGTIDENAIYLTPDDGVEQDLVTEITKISTDTQVPSAKAVYDLVSNIDATGMQQVSNPNLWELESGIYEIINGFYYQIDTYQEMTSGIMLISQEGIGTMYRIFQGGNVIYHGEIINNGGSGSCYKKEIVRDVSDVSTDDDVPTAKAVFDFVDKEAKIQTFTAPKLWELETGVYFIKTGYIFNNDGTNTIQQANDGFLILLKTSTGIKFKVYTTGTSYFAGWCSLDGSGGYSNFYTTFENDINFGNPSDYRCLSETAIVAALNEVKESIPTVPESLPADGGNADTVDGKHADEFASAEHEHPTDTSRASKAEFDSHTGDTTKHITSTERTNWNTAKTHADSTHAPTNAEKNQNAFSNVKAGSTTISADTTTDTIEFVAGSNITLTPDATNDKLTITAKDTVYTHPTTAGNKHIPSGGSSGQILRWGADGTAVWGSDNNTTYNPVTQSVNGLMTAADKKKLDGIATGANAYSHPTTSGNKHIPSGGAAGNILHWSADGTAMWGEGNRLGFKDTRNVDTSPSDMPIGLSLHLKNAGANGISDGAGYEPTLMLKPYYDKSGSPFGELALTSNNNLWFRTSVQNSDTDWKAWKRTMSAELLWANPNPFVPFAEQTHTFSESIAHYSYFLVTAVPWCYDGGAITKIFFRNQPSGFGEYYLSENTWYRLTRSIKITDTTIEFGAGGTNGATAPERYVPWHIYGIC